MENQLPIGFELAPTPSSCAEQADSPAIRASQFAEIQQLRADLERLRAERNRLIETQQRIMELLGTKSPEKLVHDLRNVLNERELFKALFQSQPG